MARDQAQVRQRGAQLRQQPEQRLDLRVRIGFAEILVAAVVPVWIAPAIDQFDADRARVVAEGVMGDALVADEAHDAAVAVDVIVAAVAGLRLRMADALAELARQGQVRQLRAMDHDEVDGGGVAPLEARHVAQRLVADRGSDGHGPVSHARWRLPTPHRIMPR
jgi:hypothetical protein